MENALSVTPSARHGRQPLKLAPLNRQDILKRQGVLKGVPLRPMESRVFSKLYDNSHRLEAGKQTRSSCKERMPSTPVDVGRLVKIFGSTLYGRSILKDRFSLFCRMI